MLRAVIAACSVTGCKIKPVITGRTFMYRKIRHKLMLENVREPWKLEEVLLAVDREDGETTTAEIRMSTALDLDQVNYQVLRNLEPAGLVETEKQESEDGRTPPKLVRLTESGETLVDQIRERRDGGNVESELTSMAQKLEELSDRTGTLESRMGNVDPKELRYLADRTEGVEEALADVERAEWGGLDTEALEVIARLRATARAYQRFVSEVLDREDELKPLVLEEREKVYEEMGLSSE